MSLQTACGRLFQVVAQVHPTYCWWTLASRRLYFRGTSVFSSVAPLPTSRTMTTQTRNVHLNEDHGFVKRVFGKLKLTFKKYKLKGDAYRLYECVADRIDYGGFTEELALPDTFQTWFMLTELHVWMLMVRAMADADSGRAVRNSLVEALWQDVAQRVKKLGSEHSSVARQQVLELSEQFQASLVSYDEGLLSGDTVLASALWRRLFAMGYPDPYHLECMVRYIRKSVYDLDKLDLENVILKRRFQWMPLNEVFGRPADKKL